jgi:hypothetical protein
VNAIPRWTGATAIGDSMISQTAGGILVQGTIGAAGSLTERARVKAIGEWTPYTPLLTANVGTWTLGAGSMNCSYMQIGTTTWVQLQFEGTSLSADAVMLTASLPVTPAVGFNKEAWAYVNGVWRSGNFLQFTPIIGNIVQIYAGPTIGGSTFPAGTFTLRQIVEFPF